MRIERYRTSLDEPTVLIEPDAAHPVQIEAQPDGFGMVWPTSLEGATAIKSVLSMLPPPRAEDEAVVVYRPTPERQRVVRRIPSADVLTLLADTRSPLSAIRVDLNHETP